jgi:sugar lactone lactonase YvrE
MTYARPEPFAEVPAEYRLVEGIAWDAKTQRLFIGTVIEGRLAYRDPDGSWHEVPVGSPRGGLFGMAVDAPRRLLWIATSPVQETADVGERMRGLIAVDLDTLKVARRVPIAPGGAGAVGDLAIAADGTVYASNVLSGAIHRCAPGCTVLSDLFPAGTFPNPQGLVVSRGGERVYIADYLTGLWVANPRTGRRAAIRIGEPMMLDGIDGLAADGHDLIAIQNGTRPLRIMRFTLDRDGDRIVRSQKWIAVPAGGGEPTLGVVRPANGDLLYVGDGQWERYGPGGVLRDGQPLRPTPILTTVLADIIV